MKRKRTVWARLFMALLAAGVLVINHYIWNKAVRLPDILTVSTMHIINELVTFGTLKPGVAGMPCSFVSNMLSYIYHRQAHKNAKHIYAIYYLVWCDYSRCLFATYPDILGKMVTTKYFVLVFGINTQLLRMAFEYGNTSNSTHTWSWSELLPDLFILYKVVKLKLYEIWYAVWHMLVKLLWRVYWKCPGAI